MSPSFVKNDKKKMKSKEKSDCIGLNKEIVQRVITEIGMPIFSSLDLISTLKFIYSSGAGFQRENERLKFLHG